MQLLALQIGVMEMLFVGFVVVLILLAALLLARQYRRCGENQILVVYGHFPGTIDNARTLVGGGRIFVLPLIQNYAYISLDPQQISIAAGKKRNGAASNVR